MRVDIDHCCNLFEIDHGISHDLKAILTPFFEGVSFLEQHDDISEMVMNQLQGAHGLPVASPGVWPSTALEAPRSS